MNAKQDNLITVLDAGSSKVCVLVAELQDGVLRYRGHGIEPARGMRKGLIAELGPAAEAITFSAVVGVIPVARDRPERDCALTLRGGRAVTTL